MSYLTLKIERRGAAGWIWMHRPGLHNAFDGALIDELTEAFAALDHDPETRVIVLAGEGKSFSAGGGPELDEAPRCRTAGFEPVRRAQTRHSVSNHLDVRHADTGTCSRRGTGGGMGLASACDICIAATIAQFATSEVRLGIIPAVIGPYVVRAIGERQAYRYFQTGERIGAERARELGLAHEVVAPEILDAEVQKVVDALLSGGPLAQAAATDQIRSVAHRAVDDDLVEEATRRIATLRATPEAAEGLSAFLEKRPAAWVPAKA